MNSGHRSPIHQVALHTTEAAAMLSEAFSQLYDSLGVSLPEKSILDLLVQAGPSTVPQIARLKGVSRQHVQVLVNNLRDRKFVELSTNPAHKRSVLIGTTQHAHDQLELLQAREDSLFSVITDRFLEEDLELTARTLRGLAISMKTAEFQQSIGEPGDSL